ncbi:MAG: hypothetical protein D6725_09835, partial [Planctomycetota bacterium]
MSWQAAIAAFFGSPLGRRAVLSRLRRPRGGTGTACAAETPEGPLPRGGAEQTDEPRFPAALARFLPGGASDAWPRRIAIRPVQLREGLRWQFTLQFDDHDVHVNLPSDEAR